MTDPIKLHDLPSEPVSGTVVEYIENVLEMAKRGELSSVAMAYVFRDGATGQGWSTMPKTAALVGSIAILQHRLLGGNVE